MNQGGRGSPFTAGGNEGRPSVSVHVVVLLRVSLCRRIDEGIDLNPKHVFKSNVSTGP